MLFLIDYYYMHSIKQAKIITPDQVGTLTRELPASWKKARGVLKHKDIDPLSYQRSVRKEWEQRLKRQIKLGLGQHS